MAQRQGFYTPGFAKDGGDWGYGGTQDWQKTPFVTQFLDPEIPQGVYTSFLEGNGFGGGLNRRAQWARGQYGQTQSGYQAALRENPTLTYRDYLTKQFGKTGMEKMWRTATPNQRGEQTGAWAGPTRIITWG